jgi:hypothetical protein
MTVGQGGHYDSPPLVTNRIVAFMREHYGRGPIKAKTRTRPRARDAPRLPAAHEGALHRDDRGAQRAQVLAFLSLAHVEPDLTIEMFLMDGPMPGFGALELVEPADLGTGEA